MSAPRAFPHLSPQHLVRDATTLGLSTFVGRYGDAPLLLVRLPDGDTELELGLSAASNAARTTIAKPLPFRTKHQTNPTGSRRPEESRPERQMTLHRIIERNAHFIVPLRKREGSDAVLMGHISVGRAHNKDIVLRHSSVSKFHAWFEIDPSDELYLSDAGSTNLSRINGVPVEPKIRNAVGPGDAIRFGAVETVICSSETLWACLNQTLS